MIPTTQEIKECEKRVLQKAVDLYETIESEPLGTLMAIRNDTLSLLIALKTYIKNSEVR